MIAQRPEGAAPVVRAAAEALPFGDATFDAALAVATIHHWEDLAAGLAELRRVASRVVIATWDLAVGNALWVIAEYFPQVGSFEADRMPPPEELAAMLGGGEVRTVPIPADCQDGFIGAYWRRPEAFLDPVVRAGMSSFAAVEDQLGEGVARLAADLRSGAWHEKHRDLLARQELDVGYRLVVAG
jgi:SAM-dependent methyltransferase